MCTRPRGGLRRPGTSSSPRRNYNSKPTTLDSILTFLMLTTPLSLERSVLEARARTAREGPRGRRCFDSRCAGRTSAAEPPPRARRAGRSSRTLLAVTSRVSLCLKVHLRVHCTTLQYTTVHYSTVYASSFLHRKGPQAQVEKQSPCGAQVVRFLKVYLHKAT